MSLAPTLPSPEFIASHDRPGPRYTSYPTADRFQEPFAAAQLSQHLQQRQQGPEAHKPLSVYVHIPFCQSVCYYCACNKIVTKHADKGVAHVSDLLQEMDLVSQYLGYRPRLSQLHFGGGTPTFLNDASLQLLIDRLHAHFDFLPQAECSIEIDPRTVDVQRLQQLRAQGFNRVSFGVQDFDAQVQAAVHRVQSTESVFALTQAARDLGFHSVNVDLIYGLPQQTPATFTQTLHTLAELRPDRVAVYAYAHLPTRFMPQRRIHEADLPSAHDKLAMLHLAVTELTRVGYQYIGMDHFAVPDDSLAVAQQQGTLHRNFMGYTTQPDCDMLGFGVSSIGRMGDIYIQNHRTIEAYQESLAQGELPVIRGYALNRDDEIRRAAITAIMCHDGFDFADFEREWGVAPRDYFASQWGQIEALSLAGLVRLSPQALSVTPLGRYFLRPIAMCFDGYLQHV